MPAAPNPCPDAASSSGRCVRLCRLPCGKPPAFRPGGKHFIFLIQTCRAERKTVLNNVNTRYVLNLYSSVSGWYGWCRRLLTVDFCHRHGQRTRHPEAQRALHRETAREARRISLAKAREKAWRALRGYKRGSHEDEVAVVAKKADRPSHVRLPFHPRPDRARPRSQRHGRRRGSRRATTPHRALLADDRRVGRTGG